jgi:hypothetical protein
LRVAVAERLGWKRYTLPGERHAYLFLDQSKGWEAAPPDAPLSPNAAFMGSIPPYEADMATALRLIQEARDRGLYLTRHEDRDGVKVAFDPPGQPFAGQVVKAPFHEEAAALCRAFLIAVG